jgi:hypothetical protein
MKRIVVSGLWFYAGWVLGAFLALMLGLNSVLGPAMGAAAAVMIAVAPRREVRARPVVFRGSQLET